MTPPLPAEAPFRLDEIIVEIDMAECGDLQAIQFLARCHPDPEEREMWESISISELADWGLLATKWVRRG